MATNRDIMTPSPECIGENESITHAAERMAELDVGAMPICGEDNKLKGMLTDRDIVVKVIAQGKDPSTCTAGECASGKPIYVSATEEIDAALSAMADNKIRRVPVIDENGDLVGIISQGDIAQNIEEREAGRLVEVISAAP